MSLLAHRHRTHFNRCKKVHAVAALGFKIKHFKEFLQTRDADETSITDTELIDLLNCHKDRPHTMPLELKELLMEYDEYFKKTLNGDHGYTAKFISTYIYLVDLYHLLEKSLRNSDTRLYEYTLYHINAMFFLFDHPNYSRWLMFYRHKLSNIDNTHIGMKQQLENGALSVRRTNKNFARTAVDLTLEQTINANASNRLTGISTFTNSLSARQRWIETHGIRMSIESNFYESIGFVRYNSDTDSAYKSQQFNKKL